MLWSSIIIIMVCAICRWIYSLNSCIFLNPECSTISTIAANTLVLVYHVMVLLYSLCRICYSITKLLLMTAAWYQAMKANKYDRWWYSLFICMLHGFASVARNIHDRCAINVCDGYKLQSINRFMCVLM